MDDVSVDDVETALTVLDKIKALEGDHDHKLIIEDIRQVVRGVYGRDMPELSRDELDTAEEVLSAIDPEKQNYTDIEAVEEEVERGLRWLDIYRDLLKGGYV